MKNEEKKSVIINTNRTFYLEKIFEKELNKFNNIKTLEDYDKLSDMALLLSYVETSIEKAYIAKKLYEKTGLDIFHQAIEYNLIEAKQYFDIVVKAYQERFQNFDEEKIKKLEEEFDDIIKELDEIL